MFKKQKLLVHLHLYYQNQTDWFIKKLKNITDHYDLWVTITEENNETIQKIKQFKPDANILKVENRGFDVYPFIQVLNKINLDDYIWVLKIHTKNYREKSYISPNNIIYTGFGWRNDCIKPLIGNKFIYLKNKFYMRNKKTGIIASKNMLTKYEHIKNIKITREILKRLNIKYNHDKLYPAGTMFFIRSNLLKPLLTLNLKKEDFPEIQNTGNVGTTAHAIEIIIGYMCENKAIKGVYTIEYYLTKKFKKILTNLFSVNNIYKTNGTVHKSIAILGLKFKFKNKKKELEYKINSLTAQIQYCNSQIQKYNDMYDCYVSEINKEKINYEILNNQIPSGGGISNIQTSNNPKLIVSLTSYPARMYDIHYCIYSLLNQTKKPDKIILWLVKEEFENKQISPVLLKLQENGLTIKWSDKKIKSYGKLINTLTEFPDDIIVTADDDVYYPENWLEILYNEYNQNPNLIHAHRCHKIDLSKIYTAWKHCISDNSVSYKNFITGVGGVLYPPDCFYCDVLNEELFKSLAFNQDDIWFWAMAVLNGTKIKVCDNPIKKLIFVTPKREFRFYNEKTLGASNCLKNQNDIHLNNILEYYPEIKKRIIEEDTKI